MASTPGLESRARRYTGAAFAQQALRGCPHVLQVPEKDAIVAEMIPQNRPKEWTLAALRGLANDGRQILITGQLMFDSHHKIGDSPHFSLWEVHPTTRLLVCRRPDNNCDPAVADQWKPL